MQERESDGSKDFRRRLVDAGWISPGQSLDWKRLIYPIWKVKREWDVCKGPEDGVSVGTSCEDCGGG